MFRTVSQTRIHYRESRLSQGRAGPLCGGDRLPWFRFTDGRSNYDALSQPVWQVHIYGSPRPDLESVCHELGLLLHCFPWEPDMENKGVIAGSVFLLRPDQYIALASQDAVPAEIRNYFETRRLRV